MIELDFSKNRGKMGIKKIYCIHNTSISLTQTNENKRKNNSFKTGASDIPHLHQRFNEKVVPPSHFPSVSWNEMILIIVIYNICCMLITVKELCYTLNYTKDNDSSNS